MLEIYKSLNQKCMIIYYSLEMFGLKSLMIVFKIKVNIFDFKGSTNFFHFIIQD